MVREPGGPLQVEEVPDPVPAGGQVLVRVAAAGVNFADVVMRRGGTRVAFPLTPGVEGAGTVEATGERVAWVPVKQASAVGSYAALQAVDRAQLFPVPDHVPLELAAAVLLQGLTAHYLAHDQHAIGPGTTVLVHAAAGGTGRLVVQWCKRLGATVLATVSTEAKAEVARAAGADHVIRYTEQDFVAEVQRLTGGAGADYIVDGVAGATFRRNLEAVAARGRICVFGMASGPPEPLNPLELLHRSITVAGGSMVNYLRTPEEVAAKGAELWAALDDWLVPLVHATLPLEEAEEAHRLLGGRETVGKLVLVV